MNPSSISKDHKPLRLIETCAVSVFSITPPNIGENLAAWIEKQVKDYSTLEFRCLLAHADDGVIWGRMEDGKLLTSSHSQKTFLPALRLETLRDARLFSQAGELLVWHDGAGGYSATLTCDSNIPDEAKAPIEKFTEYFDEEWLLLGTERESVGVGFTQWTEGSTGMRHSVPLQKECGSKPILKVRHYLADEPLARIAGGRLLDLV